MPDKYVSKDNLEEILTNYDIRLNEKFKAKGYFDIYIDLTAGNDSNSGLFATECIKSIEKAVIIYNDTAQSNLGLRLNIRGSSIEYNKDMTYIENIDDLVITKLGDTGDTITCTGYKKILGRSEITKTTDYPIITSLSITNCKNVSIEYVDSNLLISDCGSVYIDKCLNYQSRSIFRNKYADGFIISCDNLSLTDGLFITDGTCFTASNSINIHQLSVYNNSESGYEDPMLSIESNKYCVASVGYVALIDSRNLQSNRLSVSNLMVQLKSIYLQSKATSQISATGCYGYMTGCKALNSSSTTVTQVNSSITGTITQSTESFL